MTSYYNLSQNLSNMNTFQDLLNLANTTTNGTYWSGIYWMFIIIIFLSSIMFGWEIAFGIAFFGGLIIGMFLHTLGLISMVTYAATEAALIFISFIYLLYSSKSHN